MRRRAPKFQSTANPKAGRILMGVPAADVPHVSIHGQPEGRPNPGHALGTVSWSRVSIHGQPEGRPNRAVHEAQLRLRAFQSTANPKAGRIP